MAPLKFLSSGLKRLDFRQKIQKELIGLMESIIGNIPAAACETFRQRIKELAHRGSKPGGKRASHHKNIGYNVSVEEVKRKVRVLSSTHMPPGRLAIYSGVEGPLHFCLSRQYAKVRENPVVEYLNKRRKPVASVKDFHFKIENGKIGLKWLNPMIRILEEILLLKICSEYRFLHVTMFLISVKR